jgi:dTDP-4-dehydrorhamnose 3,5-epimerase
LKFTPTPLLGAFVVDIEPQADERGMFARTFCRDEFAAHGLPATVIQCNLSTNRLRGTLRGLHYQAAPFWEAKVVRCTRGAIFDVIVDLRPDSTTFKLWYGVNLSEQNARALFVPQGFAHGFQALTDDSHVFYQMTEAYHADLARGVRWNDPAFGIQWPLPDPILSQADASFRDFARSSEAADL